MPTYNFTSDLRISVLPERIHTAATEIINNELSSDKSASNNRATLAFYFNLVEGTNTLKLAANDSITEVVRNFVRKFQFPNTYTAELFDSNIKENTLIAPLRETVKLLAYQFILDGDNNPYLTYDEIRYYVFGKPDAINGATAEVYKKVLEEIHKNRINGYDYSTDLAHLLSWKQYERQSRELISVIPYACDSFKTSNGKLILWIPDPLSNKFTDTLNFIASIMNEDKMWMPTDKIYNQSIKDSYTSYMDINGEVELCPQSSPSIEFLYRSQIKEPLQLIYYGAPGTGKSFTIDKATDESNSIRTTFHPDSDYSCFVGAYKPTMEHNDITFITSDGKIKYAKPEEDRGKTHSGKEKKIVYKYVPQAFLKAYVAAWKDLENPHFLVIEEINRGNCAQIFGDLFQLLDRNNTGCSSYAIHADNDIAKFIREDKNGFGSLSEEQKEAISSFVLVKDSGKTEAIGKAILTGEKLLLPPNLYIWATMNTSDQSLFPIDSAFKRRWNWKYMPIEYNPIDKKTQEPLNWKFQIGKNLYSWGEFLGKVNPEIYELTDSSDKQMGYFFAKADPKTGVISEDVFLNKVLFYLWTDVLKDYDVSRDKFINKKANRTFRFTDFFEDPNALENFVANFDLTIFDEKPSVDFQDEVKENDAVFDSTNDEDLNDNKNPPQRDYSRYSVNGKGRYNKSDAVVAAMTAFVESLSNLNSKEILEKIKQFNLTNTLAYSEEEYKYYLNKSTDPRFAKRYARIENRNGECIYVYRGSTPERIGELIKGLNNSGTGVTLTKVE